MDAEVRSTKAGTVIPATPAVLVGELHSCVRSTKAGTVIPATPGALGAPAPVLNPAQRRPGP